MLITPDLCLNLSQGNETDWKLIGIDLNDPLAPLLNSKSSIFEQSLAITAVKAKRLQ
jgi:hypothetical protein